MKNYCELLLLKEFIMLTHQWYKQVYYDDVKIIRAIISSNTKLNKILRLNKPTYLDRIKIVISNEQIIITSEEIYNFITFTEYLNTPFENFIRYYICFILVGNITNYKINKIINQKENCYIIVRGDSYELFGDEYIFELLKY